jgi:hypothetical protein
MTEPATTAVAYAVARKDRAEQLARPAVDDARHFVNLTWVSRPIAPRVIDADALFAGHVQRYGQ